MVTAEKEEALAERIGQELRRLHIFANLKGYNYLLFIIGRTVRDPALLQCVLKGLYQPAAEHFGTTVSGVERAVRTAINICWSTSGRETLSEMVGCRLTERPYSKEFIDIVAEYIGRRKM